MNDNEYPVHVAVRGPDGSVEQVRVGTATRSGEGFVLRLGELTIGAQASAPAPRPTGLRPAPIPGAGAGAVSGPLPTVFPNYGRGKGAPIHGAGQSELEYYANGARRSLADPAKSRWHDKERALLAAIEAEVARQGGGGGGGFDEEPPPLSDADMPPPDES